MYIFSVLFFVIVFILIATIKFKFHPVFSLIIAALISGALLGIEAIQLLETISEGFGKTLSSIGLIIAFGTVIGIFLERTNATKVMANTILKIVGLEHSALAMNITGFVISIPVFCDSGFIILSSLNKALSKKTGLSIIIFAVSLATGLYASHVFVPPTPGPLAAAAVLNADLGLVVAIPVSLVGFLWANYIGRKIKLEKTAKTTVGEEEPEIIEKYTVNKSYAFAPLVVPIFLIALKSIIEHPSLMVHRGMFYSIISFIGICIAFSIAAILKTAQGSSTVAIITAAAIMAPLLTSLGLETSVSKACTVLAIGAGAMTISHVNDSYFWVVTQFSNMDVKTALKSQSVATLLQGITGLLLVLGIQYFFG